MISVENEYYLRVYLLLFEGSSYITKEIIRRELPKYGGDLDALLKKNEGKLQHEFHKKQMEKLFRRGGYDKTNINTWDMQMLVGVILIIFRPTLSNTEKEKLKEIKDIRNTLAHGPAVWLNREKYDEIKQQIKVAIEELASGFDDKVKTKCGKLISTYIFDLLDVTSAMKRLQEQMSTDDKFQELLDLIAKSQNILQKGISDAESNIRKDLEDLKERVKTVDEKSLQGLDEIIRKLDVVKEQATKRKVYKDVYTQTANTEYMETVQVLEKKIDQLINAVNRMVNPAVRTTLRPYDRSSETGEPPCYRSSGHKEIGAENSQDTAYSSLEQPSAKPSVEKIRDPIVDSMSSSLMIVCAIDVGTSFSGYAFSFGYSANRITIPVWTAGNLMCKKTSTSILFDPNKQFHSFGFEAENKYAELAEENMHMDWYFFQRFKMQLYAEKLTRTKELEGENGKKMDAMVVFAAAIKYFRDKLWKNLEREDLSLRESDIYWVLTVPAIWTDSAKQFMRESAVLAGITLERLSIVLESESASLYCQMGNLEGGTNISCLLCGKKYMVIDMGGGTVDSTVCEKPGMTAKPEMTARVLHKVSAGGLGGTEVDKDFFQLITSLTGQEVFSEFCRKDRLDYLDLEREFECKKRNIGFEATGMINFRIPRQLEMCMEETGKNFKQSVHESAYRENVSYRPGRLKIDALILKTFFTPCCEKVVRHISDILKTSAAKGIQILLLTGGFSNSELMQNAIANAFPNLRVLVLAEPEDAVLKGAVIFGHTPQTIQVRRSPCTYGIEITPLFDPSVHPESRRVSVNGQDRCKNVFRKFITMTEIVTIGNAFCHEHATLIPYQEELILNIYASPIFNPTYVDEEGVRSVGNISLRIPRREKSIYNVIMRFNESSLEATVVDLQDNTEKSASFGFL